MHVHNFDHDLVHRIIAGNINISKEVHVFTERDGIGRSNSINDIPNRLGYHNLTINPGLHKITLQVKKPIHANLAAITWKSGTL